MKLEDQVCTLDQAKRLKELGVGKPDTGWNAKPGPPTLSVWMEESPPHLDFHWNFNNPNDGYPAFTVAELGVMLPKDHQWCWPEQENMTQWACARCVDLHTGSEATAVHYGPTEAQARAALLIHLLSVRAITPEQVNTRLQ